MCLDYNVDATIKQTKKLELL